jgi:hypothetical protein
MVEGHVPKGVEVQVLSSAYTIAEKYYIEGVFGQFSFAVELEGNYSS